MAAILSRPQCVNDRMGADEVDQSTGVWTEGYIDDLVCDCSISSVLAMETLHFLR